MTEHENDALLTTLAGLNDDVPPMPEHFHADWTRLVEENAMERKTNHSRIRRTLTQVAAVAAALVLVIGGSAIGHDIAPVTRSAAPQTYSTKQVAATGSRAAANGGASYAMSDSAPMMLSASYDSGKAMEMAEAADMDMAYAESAVAGAGVVNPSKIIRTASLSITTQEYDKALAGLRALCEQTGGWVSSSSESTRSNLRTAYLTLRIPAEQLDLFLDGTGDAGRVTSRSEYANDVSESYYDTLSRLETQKALLARLTSLMTDAADLSDLLELEGKIADVQYTIDRLQASLNSTDRQVSYSTVDITLREELPSDAFEPDTRMTLGRRIAYAFQVGLENFGDFFADTAVFLVAALPFLVILGAGIAVIVVVRKKHRKQ